MENIPNLKYKTTLCLNWSQGLFCEKEEGCYFAHGQLELRSIEQNREAVAFRNRAHLDSRPPTNYKTIFCRFYGKGECKLGDACTYAHQRREKKMRKASTISYQMEHQYALYAYYSQLVPWVNAYNQFPVLPQHEGEYFMHAEHPNEQMKKSSETASSEREASPVQKIQKSSEECTGLVLLGPPSQDVREYQQEMHQSP